jgi:hypothetical protein
MTNQSYSSNNDLLCEDAKVLFEYKDGELFWKQRGKSRQLGRPAGAVNRDGYRRIKYQGKLYAVHRLVWAYHGNEPVAFIDHINGDVLDNHIENLRGATHSQNCMNRRVRFDSRSGVKGVTRRKDKWHACITLNYKCYSGGYFDCKEDAITAVDKLRKELHGEFARS